MPKGAASPCLSVHKARSIATSVHADDVTSAGPNAELDCLQLQLEGKYKTRLGGRQGPGDQDSKDALMLNRAIRWTEQGLEYEADPRHGERLLEGLGLAGECKSVASPGLKPLLEQLGGDKVLPASEVTGF